MSEGFDDEIYENKGIQVNKLKAYRLIKKKP